MPTRSVTVASVFVVFALSLPTQNSHVQKAAAYKIGSKVADFAFKSDEGKTVKLSDYRGKTVVLVHFANWCSPCNEEAPHIEKEVWQKFKARGVQVIGLDVQEGVPDPFPKLKEFRTKHQLTYPILSDEAGTVMQKFGFIGLPTILIIDKNGKYVAHPATVPEIVAKLQKLLP